MEADVSWAKIRRGWCLGSEAFRNDMLDRIETLSGKRESFSGEEVRLHDEQEAERLLVKGLLTLGMDEESLVVLSKGADEKALLAWLLRRYCTVSNAWIAERLHMGRADCLSRYPRRIEKTEDVDLVEKREQLRRITRLRD